MRVNEQELIEEAIQLQKESKELIKEAKILGLIP